MGRPGEIVNLVGIDAQWMQDLMTYLHAVWYSFFQIGLAMYFLWGQVGPSCLAGVVVIVVMMPVTKFIAGWLSGIQKILMKARDERVALNNELLGAMKVSSINDDISSCDGYHNLMDIIVSLCYVCLHYSWHDC